MSRFIIQGGKPLSGTLKPAGNKNAALPMLAACLLTDQPLYLSNVPDIEDVRVMLALLEDLGVDVAQRGHSVHLCAAGLHSTQLDAKLCRQVRSSILLAGPLVARHGKAVLAPPGGDVIGRRRLDTHFQAFRALGIRIRSSRHFTFTQNALHGSELMLDEASVTATENIMMAATLARGKTVVYNAACEPHVQDLGCLLVKMGARITGLGTNRIEICGVKHLRGSRHTVSPDYIETGSYLTAAAVTGGSLTLPAAGSRAWEPVVARGLNKLGLSWHTHRRRIHFDAASDFPQPCSEAAHDIPKIEDGIWPAFPSDLMSVAIVLATQALGTVLFFEKLFESRMYFVDNLISMGARIVVCDPHRIVVSGPAALRGGHMNSPDIRAGMALVTAALCARGESVIENAQVVDRGYEKIDVRLQALGADIVRMA